MAERIYVFKRFERFWHWSQAGLIMFLMLTAFDIHGTYAIFGFEKAVNYHTIAAWSLVGLWVFAIFWHLTTGEWRQYIPTTEKVVAMAQYYLFGIFRNAPHPFRLTQLRKHNPLQRLAYLVVLLFISPLIWISGWLYLFYADWAAWGLPNLQLEWVATAHTLGAFMMLAFLIAHVYLTTAGHTPLAHIKAMITGWEEVD
ncbi:MAG: cytochrome b/b6 domain-containing protein [Sulfuritalea sp.]|jgi:thiosulfate reductase cytochrome b subunit|nr:cytochrome b/b6 domain-containing protein [Sulfuritalea sp.]